MNCKYCQQLLEEGNSVCPHCGKDNAEIAEETALREPEAAAAEESQASALPAEKVPSVPEMKKGITLTTGKLTAVIVGVVLLTTLVIALIMQGAGVLKPSVAETMPTDMPSEPATTTAPPATIPADGNPDDETCKGSYTVSDADAVAAMNTVVATCGDAQLTNGQLQVYYWMQVRQFLQNYGSYAAYFGLDYTQPLDTQVCGLVDSGITWQQLFLSQSLDAWHNYQALANEAQANGIAISQENQTYLDGLEASMVTEGGLQGFDSAESYLAYHVGPGASIEDYKCYMEVYYLGYGYYESQYEALLPSDAEVEAYFAEHEAEYEEQGVTRDTRYVDARHILVFPQGGTTDEAGTTTYSDEEWETCRAAAQAILDTWLAGEANEESFAALAMEKSEDGGSSSNGGLYESMYEGQMVEPFENWCFDPARQYGDYGLVQTPYGYHVMFFVGSTDAWQAHAWEDMVSEHSTALVDKAMEKHPLTVDYKAISLGFVDMGA